MVPQSRTPVVGSSSHLDLRGIAGLGYHLQASDSAERVYLLGAYGPSIQSCATIIRVDSTVGHLDLVVKLNRQEPWNIQRGQIPPISFGSTGYFTDLTSRYRYFETWHRQALWEATNAVYLPADQRNRDPELAQLYQQRKTETV